MDNKQLVWHILDTINQKTEKFIIDDDNNTEYTKSRFLIDRAFSMFPDTVLIINELNKLGYGISNQQHYDFLYYAIPKRKRFSKWAKKNKKENTDIRFRMKSFGISEKRIDEMLTILNEKEITELLKKTEKGGNDES